MSTQQLIAVTCNLLFTMHACNFLHMFASIPSHPPSSAVKNPRRGGTALHIAANEGNMEMARFLVSAGADLNAQDLYVAARHLIRFNNHRN